MKLSLWAFCLGFLPAISLASNESYQWVLKKYDAKDASVLSAKEGQIDNENFLAIISRQETGPVLSVFKRDSAHYIGIAQIALSGSPAYFPTATISMNSIFIETSF